MRAQTILVADFVRSSFFFSWYSSIQLNPFYVKMDPVGATVAGKSIVRKTGSCHFMLLSVIIIPRPRRALGLRLCRRVYNRLDQIDPRSSPLARTIRHPRTSGESPERNMRRIHIVTSTGTSAEKFTAELLRRVRELIK